MLDSVDYRYVCVGGMHGSQSKGQRKEEIEMKKERKGTREAKRREQQQKTKHLPPPPPAAVPAQLNESFLCIFCTFLIFSSKFVFYSFCITCVPYLPFLFTPAA